MTNALELEAGPATDAAPGAGIQHPEPPSARGQGVTLTVGLLTALGSLAALGTLSTNIILPSLPSIARTLAVPTADLGVTLSAFFLVFAVGQLFVGPLSDRFGRRPLVLGGLIVFLAGSLLCSAAESVPMLVAGRAIQALGACAASVLARAIARDLFQGDALARALSLMMVAMAAAPGFSPLLGGALDRFFGWQSAFLAVGAGAAALALFYGRSVGETHPADRRSSLDLFPVLRAYGRLVLDRGFIAPGLAVALLMGGLFGMFAASPVILIDGLGLSALQLGLSFAATVFIVFAAGLAAPRLAGRWGARRVAFAGLVIAFAGGALLLVLASYGSVTVLLFLACTSVFLLGMGLANPLGTMLALAPFGHQAGLASALLGFLQMAGAGLGAALVTSLGTTPTIALGALQVTFGLAAIAVFIGLPNER